MAEATVPGTAEARQKLAEMLRDWVRLSADPQADRAQLSQLKTHLDRQAWDLILAASRDGLQEEVRLPLRWTREQALAIDFGLFGCRVFDWEPELEQALAAGSAGTDAGRVVLLTQRLQECHDRFLRRREQADLEARIQAAEEERWACGESQRSLRAVRDRLGEWFLPPEEQAGIGRQQSALDGLLDRYVALDRESRLGRLKGKEQRLAYVELKGQVTRLRGQMKQQLSRLERLDKLADMESRREQALLRQLELEEELARLSDERADLAHAVESLSPGEAQRNLREEASRLRLFTRMCAQRVRAQPLALPLSRAELATPRAVADALRLVEEYDPGLFDNRLARQSGRPRALILPGFGQGIYDWSSNCFLLPTLPARSVLESLAAAVIMYRDDVDTQTNERRLLVSYQDEIKENRKVRSGIELRERLTKDYLVWITKEAFGLKILARENREWFEANLAPRKTEPKVPPRLRGLSLKDLGRRARALEAREEGPDVLYELAVARFLADDHAGAADAFETLVQRHPDHLDGVYGLAICSKRQGKARYRDLLRDYMRRAPASWWTNVAQELSQ